MRHLPKFSDDYGPMTGELMSSAILSADHEELIDAYGDDWSLAETDEVEVFGVTTH
ncbi:hypothetical protein [Thalassobaculum sp.]|uniref:hypothetical protein n=1 Tax=Thalassobaculum sp. TaxID=2022740 RepID=UPI0032EB7D87